MKYISSKYRLWIVVLYAIVCLVIVSIPVYGQNITPATTRSASVFVSPDPPEPIKDTLLSKREPYARGTDGWILVRRFIVRYIRVTPDRNSPGYIDHMALKQGKKIFYLWNGVSIPRKDRPGQGPVGHAIGEIEPTDGFTIIPIDPPVQFVKLANGLYAVGYFDEESTIFYAWKDVAVPPEQIPPVSSEHMVPVLAPTKNFNFNKQEIGIPPHLRKMVEPFIKTNTTQPAIAPSSPMPS